MKGIILAGDSGNNLLPLTTAIPKQLLPLYNKPMIYYPINTLISAGIKEIMIITTSVHQGLFVSQLGDGTQFGVKFCYASQDEPRGIAEALSIAKDFVDSKGVCLITGDNVIVGASFAPYLRQAEVAIKKSGSATIFTANEQSENQYGRVLKKQNGKNHRIAGSEMSRTYDSIVGCYVYPADVVKYVDEIELSERGRKEITSINQKYFNLNKLQIIGLGKDMIWLDVNTFDNILSSANYIKKLR